LPHGRQEDARLCGGRALKTPFAFSTAEYHAGSAAGIGRWAEADFIRAMRHGERPDGDRLLPCVPLRSFTGITDSDLRDLWAFLRTLPRAAGQSEHDLKFPFGWRLLASIWKTLSSPGPYRTTAAFPQINRALTWYRRSPLRRVPHARNILGAETGPVLAEARAPTARHSQSDAGPAQEVGR